MSKAKKVNLASIKKQMEALKEAQVQEEQRIKENLAAGFTSDAVEKLGAYSEAELKRIATFLSEHVDKCIKQLEADKAQKKAKADAAKKDAEEGAKDEIPEVADDTQGATDTQQVKSNYGYQQNGYQRNNGNF